MIAMPLGSAVYWTTAAFLIASALTILMGIFGPSNDMLTVMVKSATGLVMLALPLLRLFAAGGPGWGEAIAVGQPIIPTLDIAFLLTGVWLVRNCWRSEEHTSELQSLMRISYAVFCLKKKKTT